MLAFTSDEIEVNKTETKETCAVCEKRRAMWFGVAQTPPTEEGLSIRKLDGKVPICGWCIMYSGYCQWGHEERDEILHVGRAAQEHAAKANKPIPMIDERGRLMPEDAERFMLGVAFTSKLLTKMGKMARMRGEQL